MKTPFHISSKLRMHVSALIVKVWEVEGCESVTESNIADCSKGVGTGGLSYNQELHVCDCSDFGSCTAAFTSCQQSPT